MELLEPDWNQPKPSREEATAMCRRIALERVVVPAYPFNVFIQSINMSHRNDRQIAKLCLS
jgi:hypothetical protein